MLQLVKCAVLCLLMLVIFTVWGRAALRILKIENDSLAGQTLAGLCAFFIAMEIILLPVTLCSGSLTLGMVLALAVILAGTGWAWRMGRRTFQQAEPMQAEPRHPELKTEITPLFIIAVLLTLAAAVYAVFYRYMGWDQTNYIGTVELFVKHNSFWTYDAMNGGAAAEGVDFHYAMSVFYPLFAILCRIFGIEARIMMLYTARSLCVILSALVAYEWGRTLIPDRKQAGSLFVCIYMILSIFATANHGSSYMALIRGYEAKGYCAAVVMPLTALILVQLIRHADAALWRALIPVAWASVPISPSSLALVPAAVGIAALAIVIVERKVMPHLMYALLAILPNVVMLIAYVAVKDMI